MRGRFKTLSLLQTRLIYQTHNACTLTCTLRYARVVRDQGGAREKARVGTGDLYTPGHLTRRFMLDEGEATPKERKQLDMFKITRADISSRSPPTAHADLIALDKPAVDDGHADVSDQMSPTEWGDLIERLRQMAQLTDDKDYKTCLRQMWRTWHPDKNENTYVDST